MELTSGPIQSYQKNQNLAGWVQQTEDIQAATTETPDTTANNSEEVFISKQREIFDWVANKFPISQQNAATISRASQSLYEYQVLNFHDLNTINQILASKPEQPLMDNIELAIDDAGSFQEQKTLNHIKQVFSTLVAAE